MATLPFACCADVSLGIFIATLTHFSIGSWLLDGRQRSPQQLAGGSLMAGGDVAAAVQLPVKLAECKGAARHSRCRSTSSGECEWGRGLA